MTATVELPEKIERAVEQKVNEGEYSSKSDFIREAVRTHLDTVLLTPEKISERAREIREGEAETVSWDEFREEL